MNDSSANKAAKPQDDYRMHQFQEPTITLARIDAADPANRTPLIQKCLDEENRRCYSTGGDYWAIVPIYHAGRHGHQTLAENLTWETMYSGPRPYLAFRLYRINSFDEYCGYLDIEAHCTKLARHNPEFGVHRCINRENCFDATLQIMLYQPHAMIGYKYPSEIDLIGAHHSTEITIIYSYARNTGRLVSAGPFLHYVPPCLAETDGFLSRATVKALDQSDFVVRDAFNAGQHIDYDGVIYVKDKSHIIRIPA